MNLTKTQQNFFKDMDVEAALKAAWLATPYVSRWEVDTRASCLKFVIWNAGVRYTLFVGKSNDDPEGTTSVELVVDGEEIHTFSIPQPYNNRITARGIMELAAAITREWREAVCGEPK